MKESYTQTVYYQLRLTAKYLNIFSNQMFAKISADVSFDEFIVLDILNTEGSMCQRDLAKLLLKDRANTGRIANSLCEKKYIKISVEEKNKRLVKNLVLTESGKKNLMKIRKDVEPIVANVESKIDKLEIDKLTQLLKDCREKIKEFVDIQI